jgi:hypothetical protein
MTTMNGEPTGSPCPADIQVVPGRSRFDVVPGVFFADKGGTYYIRNHTKYTVIVTLSDRIVLSQTTLELAPKGDAGECDSFTTRQDGVGVHDYLVDVRFFGRERTDGLYASGGSDPRIVFR